MTPADPFLEHLDPDPIVQFERWFDEAMGASLRADAVALATATTDGAPSVRMVILRAVDDRGFVFYTNYESRKAGELEGNPRGAMVCYWAELDRQVCVTGSVSRVGRDESEEYFARRPRGHRIAAWVSPQSRPIPSRAFLENAYQEAAARFVEGDIPLPGFWGGYRLVPETVEFWQGRDNRLHDRVRYRRAESGEAGEAGWVRQRLAP